MKGIDHFTLDADGYLLSVTFVRIANLVGWHGSFEGSADEYGDYITLADNPITPETIKEACEILAYQAADTLVSKMGTGDAKDVAQSLRAKINKRVWRH